MPRVISLITLKTSFCLLAFVAWFTGQAFAADPSAAERTARTSAVADERSGDWSGAGFHWEQAAEAAEISGDADGAIAHCARALAAWSKVPGPQALDRQAFALGVMSKLEIEQGRLTNGRQRNLQALAIISARIREATGWLPKVGGTPPRGVPTDLLEAWARCQRDTANWLDAQGQTVAAVELLTATDRSLRAAAPNARTMGFYHRKVISARALMLKFLGFQEQAIADLKVLVETRVTENAHLEWAQQENLAYFSSQFYGPKPEYLDAVRASFRQPMPESLLERRRPLPRRAEGGGVRPRDGAGRQTRQVARHRRCSGSTASPKRVVGNPP